MSSPGADAAPFVVLAVCTGNICRSPAAERWLAAGLGPDPGVRVESAGLRAVVGAPVERTMASIISAGGGSAKGFEARQVTERMLREAGLVLGLARGHRALLVDMVPGALRRSFTLREFARLAELVDPAELDAAAGPGASAGARLAALVPLAAARRGQVRVPPSEDDVIDPVGQPVAVFERAAEQIRPAVDAIVRVVRGSGGAVSR